METMCFIKKHVPGYKKIIFNSTGCLQTAEEEAETTLPDHALRRHECCQHSQVDRRRCLQRRLCQSCQSSLLDFYNVSDLPTQHRQDDGCPVHSWKGGVCKQSFRRDSAWQEGATSVGNLQLQMLQYGGEEMSVQWTALQKDPAEIMPAVKMKKQSHSGVQNIFFFILLYN